MKQCASINELQAMYVKPCSWRSSICLSKRIQSRTDLLNSQIQAEQAPAQEKYHCPAFSTVYSSSAYQPVALEHIKDQSLCNSIPPLPEMNLPSIRRLGSMHYLLSTSSKSKTRQLQLINQKNKCQRKSHRIILLLLLLT